MKKDIKSLVEILRLKGLGEITTLDNGNQIKVVKSRNEDGMHGGGCTRCYFHQAGTRQCIYRHACFAHLRPDRKSVIFSLSKVYLK